MSFSFGSPVPVPDGGGAIGGMSLSTDPNPTGGTTSATSTSAPTTAPVMGGSTFSFTGTSASSTIPTSAVNMESSTLTVPAFDELFPGFFIWSKIGALLQQTISNDSNDASVMAGQELVGVLLSSNNPAENRIYGSLLRPDVESTAPDMNLRQRLAQNPTVTLTVHDLDRADGSLTTKQGALTNSMFLDVCAIADDLEISEAAAIALYYKARCDPVRSKLVQRCIDKQQSSAASITTDERMAAAWIAREIFVAQRSLVLRTCLMLLQYRMTSQQNSRWVCRATDALLSEGWIGNLISVIRKYTQQIEMTLAQIAAGASAAPSFWRHVVTLQARIHERHIATQSVFFAAYNVQFTAPEVVELLDLVRDLSNIMPVLDPYIDVPDPYEHVSNDESSSVTWMPHQQNQKDPLLWQYELIQTCWKVGKPDLLRCTCTLVMACIASLGTKGVLMDRYTHKANAFGEGNALVPESTSLEDLKPIHERLVGNAIEQWNRKDVLGLVKAAYALLLRSSYLSIASPRSGASPSVSNRNIDVRKVWRECIEAPSELKSFTFARLSLLPALHKTSYFMYEDYESPTSVEYCSVAEFLLSALSEFSSQYLDALSSSGDRPISRAKWEQDAEDDLKLRRLQQEQQQSFHGQFREWSGTAADSLEAVPASIDLYDRPDCMDDVIAFACALSSLGSAYALSFWSKETLVVEENDTVKSIVKLVPSRALVELESQQREDASLHASYLSFLAALSLAENPYGKEGGAAIVNEILANKEGMHPKHIDWTSLVDILRSYVRELNPQDYVSVATSSSTLGTSQASSTAYYYFDPSEEATQPSSQTFGQATASKTMELGEENTFVLLSHLAVISNVAKKSPSARSSILSINLPIRGANGIDFIGQDTILVVLFSLAVMPISPEVRGKVFESISALIDTSQASPEEASAICDAAAKAWELLDACHVLPISMLEQYAIRSRNPSIQGTQGLAFPPSSTARVRKPEKSWIPADPRYSIIYELEHVEISLGYYPSSEGFLKMLASLFVVGGCPSTLGKDWRARPGCTPYIEYVMDYLLPRISGHFMNLPGLPFRSSDDFDRLSYLALNVIESVIVRVAIPSDLPYQLNSKEEMTFYFVDNTRKSARETVRHIELIKKITVPSRREDVLASMEDFRIKPVDGTNENAAIGTSLKIGSDPQSSSSKSSLPRPKSPGFIVLAKLLSSTDTSVLNSVISILLGTSSVVSIDADEVAMAYALYVSTFPSYESAVRGTKRNIRATSKQRIVIALRPSLDSLIQSTTRPPRGMVIQTVLRTLCAVISREDMFRQNIDLSRGLSNSFVPMLQFHRRSLTPIIVEPRITTISKLLLTMGCGERAIASIIDSIGFTGSDEELEDDIVSAASSLLLYIYRSVPPKEATDIIARGGIQGGRVKLIHAFQTRFLAVAVRQFTASNIESLRIVFEHILDDLRRDNVSTDSLAYALLGILPFDSGLPVISFHCLDSLMQLIKDDEFVFGSSTSGLASSCFEILYRLAHINSDQSVTMFSLFNTHKLPEFRFWRSQLTRFVSAIIGNPEAAANYAVFHSIAWILKGAADELHVLAGFAAGTSSVIDIAPNPREYKHLSEVLFSGDGLVAEVVKMIPMKRVCFDFLASVPPEQAVSAAKESISGPMEVVQGYTTINIEKLVAFTQSVREIYPEEDLRVWARQWNNSVERDCASAHLSDAVHTVLGVSVTSARAAIFPIQSDIIPVGKTLIRILECMTIEADPNKSAQVLDDVLHTTACRNLAIAALMTASSVCLLGHENRPVSASHDVAVACNLMARAIAFSDNGNQVGADCVRRNERVATLANALALLLRDLPDRQLRDGDQYFLLQAATVLSKLSAGIGAIVQIPALPSYETLVFRSCLSVLFEVLENSSSKPGYCYSFDVLTKALMPGSSTSVVEAMINLLSLFDDNIALFLQKMAFQPQICHVLLESGLLESLRLAAEKYTDEEAKLLERVSLEHEYVQNPLAIPIPSFFIGHMDLMGAVMVNYKSKESVRDIGLKVISVVRCYDAVNQRLLKSFPVDGDALMSVLRCLAQANLLLSHVKTSSMLPVESPYLFDEVRSITMHLAQHPLPERFLGPIPSNLKSSRLTSTSFEVTRQSDQDHSWWNTIDKQSKLFSNDQSFHFIADGEDVFWVATRAAEVATYGLFILRSSTPSKTLDEFTLSRALYRCVDAAHQFEKSMGYFKSKHILDVHESSVLDQLVSFGSKLALVIAELLYLAIARVREVKKTSTTSLSDLSSSDSFCRTILLALDHSRLENLKLIHVQPDESIDENSPSAIEQLYQLLRIECCSECS